MTAKNDELKREESSPFENKASLMHIFARIFVIPQVASSNLPELQSFAAGVEKDKDAVKNGLTWWINNGMVEGHVTKLKLIRKTGLRQG